MKRIISLLVAFAMMATTLSAQVAPGLKYKDLKNMYNPKEYVKSQSDPYSRGWSGFASFVIPGLGQVIDGETGRGIAIFAGDVAVGVAANVCANKFLDNMQKDANGKIMRDSDGNPIAIDEAAAKKWAVSTLGVIFVGAIYDIWNICDAVKVAKVKNMYYQDLSGTRAMTLDLYPSVDLAMTSNGMKPVAGMTLALQF